MNKIIKIATRKSKLALWQANFVKTQLEKKYPKLLVSLVEIVTEGDQQQKIPLAEIGGKSNFVKALQVALLKNEADIAVHSIKDMSVHETDGLTLAAICERGDPRDAFLSNQYSNIDALPRHAIVGTASPRRTSLIKSLRPDVKIELLRGNVDTRLSKLNAGKYDAIILAAAGLQRLNLASHIQFYFSDDTFTPAIGQGAIGIECRTNDAFTLDLLRFLHHIETAHCVTAERRVNQLLNGDCHTAIGAHAKMIDDKIILSAMVGTPDGKIILRATETQSIASLDPKQLGEKVAYNLLQQGAREVIKHA